MIRKIISTGPSALTRAVRAASAKVGIAANRETPAGSEPEADPNAAKSNLGYLTITDTHNRAVKDLKKSDGALVVTIGDLGDRLERFCKLAENNGRPWLHIDFEQVPAFKAARTISDWLLKHRIETLFVIGSEDKVSPKIYEKTFYVLTSACRLAQSALRARNLTTGSTLNSAAERRRDPQPPATVGEAVERLISEMSLKDRTTVSNMTERELYTLNFTLGSYIRNNFAIWTGNLSIMDSCRRVSGNPNLLQKDASSVIIKELWKTLKETHKLRVIKS